MLPMRHSQRANNAVYSTNNRNQQNGNKPPPFKKPQPSIHSYNSYYLPPNNGPVNHYNYYPTPVPQLNFTYSQAARPQMGSVNMGASYQTQTRYRSHHVPYDGETSSSSLTQIVTSYTPGPTVLFMSERKKLSMNWTSRKIICGVLLCIFIVLSLLWMYNRNYSTLEQGKAGYEASNQEMKGKIEEDVTTHSQILYSLNDDYESTIEILTE